MRAWFSRTWVAFPATALAGFGLAYLIVLVFVFPLSATQRDARVPNVIGLTYADAQRQLEQSGFGTQRGEARFHNAAPRGTVLEQQPEPGAVAASGTRVMLVVSSGPHLAPVPMVIGLSREQALTELEGAGFVPGEVSERASNEPRGAVIDSRPRPGAQAVTPSPVALVISAGPTTIMVPDLVGRPLSEAVQLLRQVGLALGTVTAGGNAAGSPDPSAIVQAQTPAAGSQASAGARVDLTVGGRAP